MILPTKRVSQDRALLTIGADVLSLLEEEPRTISSLWEAFQSARQGVKGVSPVTYDWFILALDFLYALKAVDFDQGRLKKVANDTSRV